MKNWVMIPLAAVLGLMVGSWGAREDLERFKAHSQEAKAAKKASDAAGFNAFAKMVNIPDVAKKKAKGRGEGEGKKVKGKGEGGNGEKRETAKGKDEKPKKTHRISREDLRARIEEAEELWLTRVELAKTQWKARLGIADEKKSAAFDDALARMNESLLDATTALAAEIEKVDRITPELGLRLMGDAARVMAETYDDLGALVPEPRRGEVSEMQVFDFIDPAVAEPLIGVQDKLDDGWKDNRK